MTPHWTVIAARAHSLAARYPSAAEILTCYAKVIDPDPPYDSPILIPRAVSAAMQKRARDLVQHQTQPDPSKPHLCPACGGRPVAAAFRPEADGSRRSLICSRCSHEWPYPRILCPNCQEQDFDSLPVYIADDYRHLRVECCDSCRHYLIAADLVKDPEAIAIVEDIAALPLHLWASDHGYTKIEPNLFGF